MTPYYQDESVTLYHGQALDLLREMPDASANCCVTSPPYFGLRDYGVEGQHGLESSPAEYVEVELTIHAEVRRVLADDGVFWLNLGDCYSTPQRGSDQGWDKSRLSNPARVQKMQFAALLEGRHTAFDRPRKNLMGMPWRVAFALQDEGWILRNAIIWNKTNAMPESVTDRLSNRYETLFLFSKSKRYWFDLDPIREPLRYLDAADGTRVFDGRNPGDVWTIPTQPFGEAHFAVMPLLLAERCVQSGCKPGGTVLDPFSGSGTTGLAATKHGRRYVGGDLNREYLDLSLRTRLAQTALIGDAP